MNNLDVVLPPSRSTDSYARNSYWERGRPVRNMQRGLDARSCMKKAHD